MQMNNDNNEYLIDNKNKILMLVRLLEVLKEKKHSLESGMKNKLKL